MPEHWKSIPSLPGYQISNLGRLRSGSLIRKVSKDHTGSLTVTVKKDGYNTNVRIARLVGEVFCRGFHPSLRPIHRNGDRSDCRPRNLKWVPPSKVTGNPYSKNPRKPNADSSSQIIPS